MPVLHDSATELLMLAGEKLLGERVACLVRVVACAGKVMIDPNSSGTTEIPGERQDFVGWFPRLDFRLGKGAGCIHGKQFRCDPHESRKEELLTVEFRPEAHHGVEQSSRQFLARRGTVSHVIP